MLEISSPVHFDIWGDKIYKESFTWQQFCFREKTERTGGLYNLREKPFIR